MGPLGKNHEKFSTTIWLRDSSGESIIDGEKSYQVLLIES